MKKGLFEISLLLAIILLVPISLASPFKNPFTGKASQAEIGVSIEILGSAPILNILLPVNGTYLTNVSLPLEFSSIDAAYAWFSINGGQNFSLSSNFTRFNVSGGGSYTLLLSANNTLSEISNVSRTFSVNLTKFIVNYARFSGPTKGQSTNFNDYTFEQIAAGLENVTLENSNHGKIVFIGRINLTDDSDNPAISDLDSNVNISFNRISVDTEVLPNLNSPAVLSMYNMTFTNPRIRRDNAVCSVPHCQILSYNDGSLVFNVSGFSVYSVEETPSGSVDGGGGGGGGGSGGSGGSAEVALAPEPGTLSCIEQWQCGEWSECSLGLQSRSCTDSNSCGTTQDMPWDWKVCVSEQVAKGASIVGLALLFATIIVLIAVGLIAMRSRSYRKINREIDFGLSSLKQGDLVQALALYRMAKADLERQKNFMPKKKYSMFYNKSMGLYDKISEKLRR